MTYKEHQAMQQAARNNNSKFNAENRPTIHFVNEFLSGDGDVAVVRFPYHSMDDIIYTPTHNVSWPGAKYGKRVVCNEQGTCPLCDEGISVDTRVFVKFLTYTVNANNEVVLNNTVWDRPSAFADIDLKNLFDEYGDISQLLFKVKRSGEGKATRYNIQPIINTAVYPANVYVANFEELNQVDPVFIMTKSQAQYEAMLHPEQATQQQTTAAPQVQTQQVYTAAPVQQPTAPTYQQAAPVQQVPQADPAPWEAPAQTPAQPAEAPARRQVKYQF